MKLPLRYHYWTKTNGINGHIKTEKDFRVKENILPKFKKKFQRTGNKIRKVKGKYFLCLLKKRNKTTREVIDFISEKLNVNKNKIGFAGLKDKFAITEQYITIPKNKYKKINGNNISLIKIKETNKKINIGDLISNSFRITLHDCGDKNNIKKIIAELKKRGMPNYFGLQRFGINKDNHIKGKKIVRNGIKLNEGKQKIKFYIHAYQSYIFNECLNKYMENNSQPYFGCVPIIGSDTKLENNKIGSIIKSVMKRKEINIKDFELKHLKNIKCTGSKRKLFIGIDNIDYRINENVKLFFGLPKGSYATVLMGEVQKKKLFYSRFDFV